MQYYHNDGVTEDISEEFVTNCYTVSGYDGCDGTEYGAAHEVWMASYHGANSDGGGLFMNQKIHGLPQKEMEPLHTLMLAEVLILLIRQLIVLPISEVKMLNKYHL